MKKQKKQKTEEKPAPYFSTPEKIALLVAAAESWRGTPFRENSCVRGPRGGVSCHNLAAALYVETGALPPFDVPRGSARRLMHNPADTICTYLDTACAGRFATIKTGSIDDVLPGDMLVLRERELGKHIAIALPGEKPGHGLRIAHVLLFSGVMISQIADATYSSALLELRRPLNVAQASEPARATSENQNSPAH